MIPELPPEIFEEIIGYLWDDKPALSACSLASRILTTPSQKHIFACIVLRGPRELFDRQLYQHVYAMGGTSANFLRLLGASPDISAYVDCLQIIDVKPYLEGSEFSSSDDDPVYYNISPLSNTMELVAENATPEDRKQVDTPEVGEAQDAESVEPEESDDDDEEDDDDDDSRNDWLSDDKSLPLILPRLQNLKALIVDFVQSWKNLSKEIRSSLLRILQLPSFRYLEFTPFPIPLLTQAVHENFKHLYVRAHCMSKRVKNVLVPGPGTSGPIYLDSLYASHTDDFLTFLESQPNCRFKTDRLRKLGLDVDGGQGGHSSTLTLLQNCSDTLEEFIFTPNSDLICQSPIAEYQEPIDISKLTSLRKLTVYATFESEPLDNTFWWLSKFLRACSAPNRLLEDITIQVQYRFHKSQDIDLQHWNDISDALLSDYFPSLKWVHISISSLVDLSHGKEIMEQLKASKFITTLQSRRDLNVDFTFRYFNHDAFQFAPDRRWENAALTDMPMDEKSDLGDDEDDDDMISSGW